MGVCNAWTRCTDYKNKHIYKEVVKPVEISFRKHVTGPKFLMTVTFEEQVSNFVNIISVRTENRIQEAESKCLKRCQECTKR
jgi:hypothetical protein